MRPSPSLPPRNVPKQNSHKRGHRNNSPKLPIRESASKGVMRPMTSTDRKKEAPRITDRTARQLVLFSIWTIEAMDLVARKSIKEIVKAPWQMATAI